MTDVVPPHHSLGTSASELFRSSLYFLLRHRIRRPLRQLPHEPGASDTDAAKCGEKYGGDFRVVNDPPPRFAIG